MNAEWQRLPLGKREKGTWHVPQLSMNTASPRATRASLCTLDCPLGPTPRLASSPRPSQSWPPGTHFCFRNHISGLLCLPWGKASLGTRVPVGQEQWDAYP